MLLNSNHPLQGEEIKERSCTALSLFGDFVGAGTVLTLDLLCSVY